MRWNRRQRAAVVLGAMVVAAAALLPPWTFDEADDDLGPWLRPWSMRTGRTGLLSPPVNPLSGERHGSPEYLVDADPRHRPYGRVEVRWTGVLHGVVTALALTIAAVVMLKDRKA